MSFEFLPGNLISSTFTKFKNNKQLFWFAKKISSSDSAPESALLLLKHFQCQFSLTFKFKVCVDKIIK